MLVEGETVIQPSQCTKALCIVHVYIYRHVVSDAESRFGFYDRDKDEFITFDEYKSGMFGAVEGME